MSIYPWQFMNPVLAPKPESLRVHNALMGIAELLAQFVIHASN
jgi:hypothetical protein